MVTLYVNNNLSVCGSSLSYLARLRHHSGHPGVLRHHAAHGDAGGAGGTRAGRDALGSVARGEALLELANSTLLSHHSGLQNRIYLVGLLEFLNPYKNIIGDYFPQIPPPGKGDNLSQTTA